MIPSMQSPFHARRRRFAPLTLLLLSSACSTTRALAPQEIPPQAGGVQTPSNQTGTPVPAQQTAVHSRTLALLLGSDSYQARFRQDSDSLHGFWELEYLQTRDDDRVFDAHLRRVGRVQDSALELGVGIGAYAVAFDASDHEVFAIALCAGLSYDLNTRIPSALSFELSVAPEITTFKDGESLVDAILRYEAQITPNAFAIFGGRIFDAETPLSDEVSHEAFVGVRLGF